MFRTLFLAILLLFLKPYQEQQEYTIRGYAQGTDYTIKYFSDHPQIEKDAIEQVLSKIDSSMSLYKPYSTISKFNKSARGEMIDTQFKAVMEKSFEVFTATQGKFDVTVWPLVQAWGFGNTRRTELPDSVEVNSLLKYVGMDLLKLKSNFLYKKKAGVQIDLNGIAQGYSVDVVADFLAKKGIKSFVVEIGGELFSRGLKPDGSARRIGVEGPAANEGGEPQLRHIIAISDNAVTTSGNYRKFYQRGSKRISHLIDSRTGYPLQNNMISVTVVAKDAITADAYDNALMAMELTEALRFVERHSDLEAYFVYHRADGSVADTLTRGFKQLIVN